ncbi:MAG: DASS family sodium-coupled anion symporter [Bacteroidetes bacterium]|nr:DASS family sodium-coupled anion symporter [Bacteroidota bacterium]
MKDLALKSPERSKLLASLPGILLYVYLSFIYAPTSNNPLFFVAIGISLMVINLWIAEPFPIWISSLVPLLLLPLHGVIDFLPGLKAYYSTTILLFLGGFLLAYSVEKWHLHRRIAYRLLALTGDNPKGIIWGMMLTTCLISMWISNTATAIMMLPVAMSIAGMVNDHHSKDNKAFFVSLMLGIAYGANIGGVATIVGTPPNIVYKGFVNEILHTDISFLKWMLVGVPLSLIMLWCSHFMMVNVIFRFKHRSFPEVAEMLNKQSNKLGKIKGPELRTLIVFSVAAALWIFGEPINNWLKQANIPFKVEEYLVAMIFGCLLFFIPKQTGTKERLLDIKDLKKINWSILILFGGGMCMAKGLEQAGVIRWVGEQITGASDIPFAWLLLLIILSSIVLTALMSNVALAQIYLPVIFGISTSLGLDNPHILGITVTMACSFDFMFPISTPPNAVVFSSGKVRIKDMAVAGILLNIVGVVLLWLCGMYLIPFIF